MILLAVACLVFVSCGPRTEKASEVAPEEKTFSLSPEQEAMLESWDMWAELTEEQQVALVGDMKVFLDECKAKCEAKCHEEGKVAEDPKEECPEKAAKCAEFKAKWEAFEVLSLEDQKAMIDQALECAKACCKEKAEGCCDKKHEGCEKKHEGCDKH